MEFEWDERKAASNLRKHGMSFSVATQVFLDANRSERLDDSEDYGEARWIAIGLADATVIPSYIRIVAITSASSPPERPINMSSKPTRIGRFQLDPANPPKLTPKQEERLRNMTDADIDYSDLPSQAGKIGWTRPGALIPPGNKQQITLRLDADVLSFFKKTGKRYQSRINAALREYVNSQKPAG